MCYMIIEMLFTGSVLAQGHIAVLTLGKTLHANFRQNRTVYPSRWPSLTEHLQTESKIVNKHGTADFKMDQAIP